MRIWLGFVIFLTLIIFNSVQAQTGEILNEGWESGTTGWTFANGGTNAWARGTAAKSVGSFGLYVSNNGGTSNAYTTSTAQVSHVYRDIAIPSGALNVALSFDWLGNGESGYDDLKVFWIATTTTPVAGTALASGQIGSTYQGSGSFSNVTINNLSGAGSTMRLVFSWRNDNSAGTQPPAAIDNIKITYTDTQIMTEGWESGTTGWTFANGGTNAWARGTAAKSVGSFGLYVSNNGGTSNAYTLTTTQVSHVYRDIAIPSGALNVTLSFDWLGNGESGYDDLKVFWIATTTTPVAGTALASGQIGSTYQGSGSFSKATINNLSGAGSTMRLVFSWRNDNSAGTQPPAAIDNILLSYFNPCTAASVTAHPSNDTKCEGQSTSFSVTATGTSLTYQWQENNGSWNNLSNGGVYSNVTTSTLNISDVTGLGGRQYRCVVTAACGSPATSNAATLTVNTNSTPPTSITGTLSICSGSSTTLTVSGGLLGTGAVWQWFTGSCGGTAAGTGSSINVSPTSNTTYFVRASGTCNTTGCVNATVSVTTGLPASASASEDQYLCTGSSTVNLTGNTPGSGESASWTLLNGAGTPSSGAGTSLNVTVTNPNSSVVWRYSISNVCGSVYDDVVVNRQ